MNADSIYQRDKGIKQTADKMALGKSIKMYLTIFIATTCIYMVLYQYHISRQPMSSTEVIKNKDNSADSNSGNKRISTSTSSSSTSSSLVRKYNLFLWSPMSWLTTQPKHHPNQNQHQEFQQELQQTPSSVLSALQATITTPTATIRPPSSISLSPASAPIKKLMPDKSPASSSDQASPLPLQPSVLGRNESSLVANSSFASSLSSSTSKSDTTANARYTLSKNFKSYSNSHSRHNSSIARTTTTTTTAPTAIKTSNIRTVNQQQHSTATNKNLNKNLNKFVAAVTPPPLYIITPTYRRPEQLAELTRLGYTLKHVLNLLWLVIEDANKTSALVTQTLNRIGVPYEYLVAPMPEEYKKTKHAKPRGVSNRNRGLEWLRENATDGVFYFADDDNTYDISIFEQMRYTKKVSMWPVGLVTKFGVSSPIIRRGKIEGFYDGWIGGRKYPVDMAGFAVSVKFLHARPKAKMPFKPGYEEDGFLKTLAPLNHTEIELLASQCTEILTWHTQTKKNGAAEHINITKYRDTNLVVIEKILVRP